MNQNEEWISIPEFLEKNDLKSRDYVYELIRGKKRPKRKKGKVIHNTAGNVIKTKIPSKFIEGVHFINVSRGEKQKVARIHHTVTIKNGVISGGKKVKN